MSGKTGQEGDAPTTVHSFRRAVVQERRGGGGGGEALNAAMGAMERAVGWEIKTIRASDADLRGGGFVIGVLPLAGPAAGAETRRALKVKATKGGVHPVTRRQAPGQQARPQVRAYAQRASRPAASSHLTDVHGPRSPVKAVASYELRV